MINENEPPSVLDENIAEAMEENVPMEDEVNIFYIYFFKVNNKLIKSLNTNEDEENSEERRRVSRRKRKPPSRFIEEN